MLIFCPRPAIQDADSQQDGPVHQKASQEPLPVIPEEPVKELIHRELQYAVLVIEKDRVGKEQGRGVPECPDPLEKCHREYCSEALSGGVQNENLKPRPGQIILLPVPEGSQELDQKSQQELAGPFGDRHLFASSDFSFAETVRSLRFRFRIKGPARLT
jgi:hypothetical protein